MECIYVLWTSRGSLWEIMEEYSGIPSKLIMMVKGMYEQSKCAVVDGSGSYDWFDIRIKG